MLLNRIHAHTIANWTAIVGFVFLVTPFYIAPFSFKLKQYFIELPEIAFSLSFALILCALAFLLGTLETYSKTHAVAKWVTVAFVVLLMLAVVIVLTLILLPSDALPGTIDCMGVFDCRSGIFSSTLVYTVQILIWAVVILVPISAISWCATGVQLLLGKLK